MESIKVILQLIKKCSLLFIPVFVMPLLYAQEKAEALPEPIQSNYQEARPYITPDGNFLFFVRRFHPENIKGEKGLQDIWYSKKTSNGSWGTPVHAGETINNKKTNFLISTNEDGSVIVLLNASYKKMKSVLVKATLKGTEWEMEEMPFVGYYNTSDYQDFYYDFDKDVIISAIEKNDGLGGQDLHYSLYDPSEKAYTTPINMGSIINSSKDDFAPYLCADGRTLFFASYGHNSKGNADIFVSKRIGAGWETWTEPINIDAPINTRNEETYLSVSADYETIYFDSYPPGARNRNILQATLAEKFRPQPEPEPELMPEVTSPLIAEETIAEEEKTGNTTIEKAEIITEAKHIESVSAEKQNETITIKGEPTDTSFDPEERHVVRDVNQMTDSHMVVGEYPDQLLTKKVIDKGRITTNILRNVYFDFDKATLRPAYEIYLTAIATFVKENPKGTLILEGHSDDIGGEQINLNLSCKRANNVADYLIRQHNISKAQIQIECKGESKPLASNDDETMGREFNRRVEFKFVH